jgi:photosystem II stability/assembly factor-like uncharacterized protein
LKEFAAMICLRQLAGLRRTLFFLAVSLGASAAPAVAQVWLSMGPPGGDALALAADPSNSRILYLGTSDGHIFGSRDRGDHWQLLGRAGNRPDAVVTAIVVDPRDSRTLFASAWTRGIEAEGGGVFVSRDGGRTWGATGLTAHAVRALIQAPSDPDVLVAGTLDGVFRSRDAGATWERISPEGDEELRNLDSMALDPQNPDIIYAGTFHLPWKTADGGKHWAPIHAGMIDDSDVFSLIVDARNRQRIYASACSGIYRSESAGAQWEKIQGIPFSARRTYVIRQDPAKPAVVYAGTSEGLWKSADAGASWRRLTPANWVILTMVVEPGDAEASGGESRIVIGAEKLGVLVSDDGAEHFRIANDGFNHRQILSLALDSARPGRILAILAHAPEPALVTEDAGRTWTPLGPGLKTERLRRAYSSPDGWWASLEGGGLVRYDEKKGMWVGAGRIVAGASGNAARRGRRATATKARPFEPTVKDMAFSRDLWFAATEEGLFASRDGGATWSVFHFAPLDPPVSSVRVSEDGEYIWIVSLRGMVLSQDGGEHWTWHDLPLRAGGAVSLRILDGRTVVAVAQKGLYVSHDAGAHWQLADAGLPEVRVQDVVLTRDAWIASMEAGGLFISHDRGGTWSPVGGVVGGDSFPALAGVGGKNLIYAASTTDGLFAVELENSAVLANTAPGR